MRWVSIHIHKSVPDMYHEPIRVRLGRGWPLEFICEAYGLYVKRGWFGRRTLRKITY